MSNGATLETWAWMAGAAAVNVLWQGILIGVLAAVLLACLRGASPQSRYTVACVALLAITALLPLNAFLLEAPPAPDALQYAVQPQYPSLENQKSAMVPGTTPVQTDVVIAPTDAPPAASVPEPRPRAGHWDWYDRALPWIGRCWWAGILLFALYDLMGLLAVRRLRKQARPAEAAIIEMGARIAKRVGAGAAVQIRVVEGISSALVTGFFRVVILVPASMAAGLAPEALEAILAHEFAHVRRWDLWINLFQRFAEALLFFHPAAWWLTRTINAERELCCDEIALQICNNPTLYARTLLKLAEQDHSRKALALSSQDGDLSYRIRHILHRRAAVRNQGRSAALAGILCAVAVPLVALLWAWRTSAAVLPERELLFPDNLAIGSVQGRWSNDPALQKSTPWLTEYSAGWTVLDEARGSVVVPEDTQVKLAIARDGLEYLQTLDPESFYFLEAKFKALTDEEVGLVAHLTGLRALDLSDNRPSMSGAALGKLGALKYLEWLDMQRSEAHNLPRDGISQFPNLRYLAGHFKQESDNVLRQAGTLEHLEFLCLKEGPVSAEALSHIAGKKSLRGLVLDNVKLTDDSLAVLGMLPNLAYLDIRKNPLSDRAMELIESYSKLEYLNLGATGITDAGVARLASLLGLREVNLMQTAVTEACLDSLAQLPNLHTANFLRSGVSDAKADEFMEARASNAPRGAPVQHSSNPDAPRIGIVMSHYNTIGPVWPEYFLAPFYSYMTQSTREIAAALNEANFDVYAILEPRTRHLGELPGILRENGLVEKVVDGTDPAALAGLDAILACGTHNLHEEMTDAIGVAVEAGTGLVIVGALGDLRPGESNPSVRKLTGMGQVEYINMQCQDAPCAVLTPHPLLEDREPGSIITVLTPQGISNSTGQIDGGTALLGAPDNYPYTFPTLYVRDLGHGRIVRCQWHYALQPHLPYPGLAFYVRALNWAAWRKPDEVW